MLNFKHEPPKGFYWSSLQGGDLFFPVFALVCYGCGCFVGNTEIHLDSCDRLSDWFDENDEDTESN